MRVADTARRSSPPAAPAAAEVTTGAGTPAKTRVRGIDLSGYAGTWDSTLPSAGTHWASKFSRDQTAAGRPVVTNLRLPGQYDERLLSSLGLQGPYYNWNRWYLPGVGRYLELDPLALDGDLNGGFTPDWYGYAEFNPLRNTDRWGLLTEDNRPRPVDGRYCDFGVCVPMPPPPDSRSCETKCTDAEAQCRAWGAGASIIGQGTCMTVCTFVAEWGGLACRAICVPPAWATKKAVTDYCFKTWLQCMHDCKNPPCDRASR